MSVAIWIGIIICITQSASLSGLNLAYFTVSRLELRIEAAKPDADAVRVLALREDSNFLLATILWGNVAVNVLLAQLSGSVLSGVLAFVFSTVLITILGEIVPQAYFSRHALKIGARLVPLLRFYQALMYPVARPTALILDRWLGPEAVRFYRERDIRELIKLHMCSSKTEIERIEGQGALNFLALDDVPLSDEGEAVDPDSVIRLEFAGDRPLFPRVSPRSSDAFLRRVEQSGRKWIVIVDPEGEPRLVMDSDEFIRDALFGSDRFRPSRHCHRPIVERREGARLGDVIGRFTVHPVHASDDVVDDDVILLWGDRRRVITGADILGRLLRGIALNPAGAS